LSLLGNIAAWQRRGQKILLIKFLESFVLKAQPFSKLRLSSFGIKRRGRWEKQELLTAGKSQARTPPTL